MAKVHIHQTHHQIADFDSIFSYIQNQDYDKDQIHLFPETYLTGYPTADLCLVKSFIESYHQLLAKIEIWAQKNLPDNCYLAMGGLYYDMGEDNGYPRVIQNVIFLASNKEFKNIYTKRLLPNYDIFDEMKYFTPGNKECILDLLGKKIGFFICEDMWPSSFHEDNPMEDYMDKDLDLLVNLSASPFTSLKMQKRIDRATEISNHCKCPFVYVNRVGGEDEILFDGRSFIQVGNQTLKTAAFFKEDQLSITFDELSKKSNYSKIERKKSSNTWQSLFDARVDNIDEKNIFRIQSLGEKACQEILEALKFGFREYASKCGFKKFTVALSGGMDSSLVLAIARLALKDDEYLEAVYMPSQYSRSISYDLSVELCKNLGVPFYNFPIKFLHSTARNNFQGAFSTPLEGLSDENIQSRLRGTLLYARSNQINSMVLNTSNKSELAVGYSTLYGDSVGAISLLGDLYKTEVYTLANYINKNLGPLIPEGIINRAPSAELREDQQDSDSLPAYDILDTILEGLLSHSHTQKDLVNEGLKEEDVQRVFKLFQRSEYKRAQFCPIIKIAPKSFGFGHRMPITKHTKFYNL